MSGLLPPRSSKDLLLTSYRDGSWGSHTQARDAVFTGTRQTRPTERVTFPHQKAEKSPNQQHVVSYNPERKLSLEATEASRESSQRVRKTNTPLSSVRRPMGES